MKNERFGAMLLTLLGSLIAGSCLAGTLQLTRVANIPSQSLPMGKFWLVEARDKEYILQGEAPTESKFRGRPITTTTLARVNSKLEPSWSIELHANLRIERIKRTRKGDYLVVGNLYDLPEYSTNARPLDPALDVMPLYLARVSPEGRLTFALVLADRWLKGYFVHDALDVGDGFVLAGYRDVPCATRIDVHGAVIWDQCFPTDGDHALSIPSTPSAVDILPSAGDELVIKLVTNMLPIEAKGRGHPDTRTLLVEIGSDGKEIHRYLSSVETEQSHLLRSSGGFALLESFFIPFGGSAPTPFEAFSARRGVSYVRLDADLRAVSSRQFIGTGLEISLKAVGGPERGYYLAGREIGHESICGTVGYLSEDGQLLRTREIPDSSRTLNCTFNNLTLSHSSDHAILFVAPSQGREIEVDQLKFE